MIYGRDGHSKLVFFQGWQDSCLVMRETSGISSRLGRAIRTLREVRQEIQGPFLFATAILGIYQTSRTVRHRHHLKH